MDKPFEHILASQCKLGEGPIWDPKKGTLYFLDVDQADLHCFEPYTTHQHTITHLPVAATALGLRAGGGLVMATRQGFALWDPATQVFDFLGDPNAAPHTRFNDGKVDPQGCFWAGKMNIQPPYASANSLFRLDPDRSIHRMESGIGISNGLGWSPDERTFYYTDTAPARKIYAYDYDPVSGEIANRRVLVDVAEDPENGTGENYPDGLAVDVDGCLWSARWGGWQVVRYDPQGKIMERVRLPVQYPTSCAFGGPHNANLYITSAWTALTLEARRAQPQSGDVFRVWPDVRGMEVAQYRG